MIIVKGFQGAVHTGTATRYDSETRTTVYRYEYQGTEAAIMGLVFQIRARGLNYQTSNNGPVFTLVTDEPLVDSDENIDRWEIFTESTEESLFKVPSVVERAGRFNDSAATSGADAYHEQIAEVVASPGSTFLSVGADADLDSLLINTLRAGVTGWQLDFLVLRRCRRLERYVANNQLRFTLDTGLILYTTAQLGVPQDVAFSLPETPSDISNLFKWRWRKRSQRAEYVGNFIEHTAELVFAPWTVLPYSDSQTALQW